jgi:hypothetical protein
VEVGVDMCLSLLVNLGAQVLFYGALATAGRSLPLAVLVIGLAYPRRFATRRIFNHLRPSGPQPHWQSWLEVVVDTLLAFGVALGLQWAFYGEAATWGKAGGLTGGLYLLTMCRRYLLRRLFEALALRRVRQDTPAIAGEPGSDAHGPASR